MYCHDNYRFKSYHIYTSYEDKYLQANEHNDSSMICIDETNQEIELSLYNRETERWMTFTMRMDYKIDLGISPKVGTLYMCTNKANQTCGVCVCYIGEEMFIDLLNFYEVDKPLSCWVKSIKV